MMYFVEMTAAFDRWIRSVKSLESRARIIGRIDHIRFGHFGDFKPLGGDLFELRFFFGPGFRVYYTIRGDRVVFLLHGGDKSRQERDIEKAREILAGLEDK